MPGPKTDLNAASTDILRQLGLPPTGAVSLREAATFPAEELFYLRYRTGSDYSNSRIPAGIIREQFATLSGRLDSGQLLTCERCYVTVVGGISLLKSEFVYSEFVQGHSNALLRRGCCGARLLQPRTGDHVLHTPPQKWSAEQREEYIYRPAKGPDTTLLEETRLLLLPLVKLPRSNLILEWMCTTEGFFYCDAHFIRNSQFGDTLPSIFDDNSHPVEIQNVAAASVRGACILVDTLDCENQEPANEGDTIVCINGALLSHFVTRTIGKKVRVVWSPVSTSLCEL